MSLQVVHGPFEEYSEQAREAGVSAKAPELPAEVGGGSLMNCLWAPKFSVRGASKGGP